MFCPSGTYSLSGATICSTCPQGLISGEGAASCHDVNDLQYYLPPTAVACGAGQYLSFPDVTTCVSCPAGTYSTQVGLVDTVLYSNPVYQSPAVSQSYTQSPNCNQPQIDSAGGYCCNSGYMCSSYMFFPGAGVTLRGMVTQGYTGDPAVSAWVTRFYVTNANGLSRTVAGNTDTDSKVLTSFGSWPLTKFLQVGPSVDYSSAYWAGYTGPFVGFRWDALVSRDVTCPSCPYGKYSLAGSSACSACGTACPAGQYVTAPCTQGQALACTSCSTACSAGTYQASACTTSQNLQCAGCSSCNSGYYQASACTTQANTVCLACSQSCPSGQTLMASCSASADIVCRNCSCPYGYYMISACTITANAVCVKCSCLLSNQYAVGGCSGFQNSVCATCTTCSAGYYAYTACSPVRDTVCSPCTVCSIQYGTFNTRQVSACTPSQDAVCVACSTCQAGYYQWATCNGAQDTVCAPCTRCVQGLQYSLGGCDGYFDQFCVACSTCPAGQYASTPCGPYTDVLCSACKTSCPANQYLTTVCSGAQDSYCAPCSTGSCPAGYYQSAACSASADRVCTACAAACASGSYQVAACTSTSNLQCTPCSACGAGQYASGGCTGLADTQCQPCSLCLANQYQATACNATSNAVCRNCSSCAAGLVQVGACNSTGYTPCGNCTACTCSQYQAQACNTTAKTVCKARTACPAGTYTTDSCPYFADAVCRACSSCPSGKYQGQACTASSDTVCLNCSSCFPGTGIVTPCTNTTNTKCSACKTCPYAGYYKAADCSVYANDTVCAPCSPCGHGYYFVVGCSCYACSSCNDYTVQYQSGGCVGAQDTVCSNKTVCDYTHGVSYYLFKGEVAYNSVCAPCQNCTAQGLYYIQTCGWNSGLGNAVCGNCSQCGSGTYSSYQTSTCTQYANTVCTACKNCSAGYYRAAACTSLNDTVCLPCTYSLPGFFMLSNCTATADARFQMCNPCPGQYASRACNATADAVCANCSTCNPTVYYTYNAKGQITGTFPQTYASVQCGGTQDTVCSPCTITPPAGKYYTSTCTTSADMQVQNCSTGPCPSGQYLAPACYLFQDNFCSPCATKCPTGQYPIKNCSTASDLACAACSWNYQCKSWQYFTVPDPCYQYNNPNCTNCSRSCAAGYYKTYECSTFYDIICAPCTICPNGKYASAACADFIDTACTPCGACAAWQYQTSACNNLNNTRCSNCTRSCSLKQYVAANCSGTSDLVCANCTACAAGFYTPKPCTAYANAVCSLCTTLCATGKYMASPCNATSDAVCVSCSNGTCPAAYQYQSTACALAHDRVCLNCSRSCAAGFYKYAGCQATLDQFCVPCTLCVTGQYQLTPCNATADAQCLPCTVCAAGLTQVVACNGTQNRVCRACNCSSGLTLLRACNATSDAVCRRCDCPLGAFLVAPCNIGSNATCSACTACPSGSYQTLPCSGLGNTACQACTQCQSGQYVSQACGGVTDAVCTACTTCGVGQYTAAECGPSSDTVCLPCGSCGYGSYLVSACTYNTPTVCNPCPTACPSGYYLDATIDCAGTQTSPCVACSVMDRYQYQISPCNATHDAVLAECTVLCPSPYQYISSFCIDQYGTSDITCANCSTCGAGQYMHYSCYFVYDTECAQCTSCSAGQYLAGTCHDMVYVYEPFDAGDYFFDKSYVIDAPYFVAVSDPGSCFPIPPTTTPRPTTSGAPVTTSTARATTSSARPTTSTAQATTSTVRPTTSTAQATASTAQATTSTAQATTSTARPTTSTVQPTTSTALVTTSTAQPTTSTTLVTTSTAKPTKSTTLATTSTAQPTTSTALVTTSTAPVTTSTARATTSTPQPITTTPAVAPCQPDFGLQTSLFTAGQPGATGPWTTLNETSGSVSRAILPPRPSSQEALVLAVPGSDVTYLGPTLASPSPPPARLAVYLKTPVLYLATCQLELAYQVSDADGRLPVATDGLALFLSLHLGSSLSGPSPCSPASPVSGAGTCALAACDATVQGWFSSAGDTLAVATVSAQDNSFPASDSAIILRRLPQYAPLLSAGIAVEIAAPSTPRYSGDTVQLALYANTGGYPLKMWGVQLQFNTSALAWTPGSFLVSSDIFGPPVLVTDVPGVLVASVTKTAQAPEYAVTSSRLPLANVSFQVTWDYPDAIIPNAFTCQIIGMLNTGGNQFLTDQPAQILDLYGGARYTGSLPVSLATPLALYAYPTASELVNWAALGGASDAASIRASFVYNRFGAPDTPAPIACALNQGLALLSVPNCSTIGPSNTTLGSGLGTVLVTSTGSNLSATLALRVWTPVNATVQVLDPILERIAAPACALPTYQRTLVSVTAWLYSGLVDVASRVALASNATGVARPAGPYVNGLSPGAASISILGATIPVTPAIVTVSNASVNATGLGVTVLTGVVWGQAPYGVTLQSQPLSSAIQTALILVTARFSDGSRTLVTAQDGASVTTADPTVLSITPAPIAGAWLASRVVSGNLSVCGPFAVAAWTACGSRLASGLGTVSLQFSRPVSATAVFTHAYLTSPSDVWGVQSQGFPTSTALVSFTVQFADGSSVTYLASTAGLYLFIAQGQSLATAYGLTLTSTGAGAGIVTVGVGLSGLGGVLATYQLQVATSAATGAVLSVSTTRLAGATDPAAYPPFNVPSSAQLTTTVSLLDGSTVVITSAQGARYRLSNSSGLAIVQDTLYVSGSPPPSVIVYATFPNLFFKFTTQLVTLPIVAFQSLTLALAQSSGGTGDPAVLRRIHCSGQFQASDLSATGTLTDGTTLDVVPYSTTASANTAIATISAGPRVLAIAPGTTSVSVAFHGSSQSLPVTVSDASIHAVSVAMQGVPSVFEDIQGATRTLSLAIAFDDNSVLGLSQSYTSWAWVRAPDLLADLAAFASGYPPAVSVGASTGVAQLDGNHYQFVNLSVSLTACDSGPPRGYELLTIPNLMPSHDGDVDIGDTGGLPVQPIAPPAILSLPVYLRSDAALKSFEVLLTLDDSLLGVAGCTAGSDWAGGFSCRTNDPVGTILLAGADVVSTRAGARIHIGDVQLAARQPGLAHIAGTTIKAASSAAANACPACPVTAGDIVFQLTGAPARTTRQLLARASWAPPVPHTRRLLGDASAPIYGDVDGDGRFDTADCLMTQEFFLNLRLGPGRALGCPATGGNGCRPADSLTAWQRKQMDQVSDPLAPAATPDYRDFSFMLQVYANNERFLTSWDLAPNPTGGFSLRVQLRDGLGLAAAAQCRVRFVLATTLNLRMRFTTSASASPDGLLITGVNLGGGWHGIESLGPALATENITFALLLETFDALGQSIPDRRFPFYGTTVPPYDAYYQAYVPFGLIPAVAPPKRSPTPAPATPPPSEPPPLGLSACCNATVTFAASPASLVLPTRYSLTSLTLVLANGTAIQPNWDDPRLAYAYDTQRLALITLAPPTFAVLPAPYTRPLQLALTLQYAGGTGANASSVRAAVTITLVDVSNVTLIPTLPNPRPYLYRLHCTQAFQTASFSLTAYVDGVGDLLARPADVYVSPAAPRVATGRGNLLIPLAPGSTDVVVTWWGYTRVYPNLTVLNESVAFASAYSPPYIFTGQRGETLPLQLTVSEIIPGTSAPTPPQPLLLPNPALVLVSPPASVALANTSDALVSVANTLEDEFVAFIFTGCAGATLSFYAPVLVNLAPGPYDLDLGLEGPVLALQPDPASGIQSLPNRHAQLARQRHRLGRGRPYFPLDLLLLRVQHPLGDLQRPRHCLELLQLLDPLVHLKHQIHLILQPHTHLIQVVPRLIELLPEPPVL